VILEARQRGEIHRWQHIGARRQQLPELDEGWSHRLELDSELFRVLTRCADVLVRGFTADSPGRSTVLDEKAADLAVTEEVLGLQRQTPIAITTSRTTMIVAKPMCMAKGCPSGQDQKQVSSSQIATGSAQPFRS
jgi:hypothetical protein